MSDQSRYELLDVIGSGELATVSRGRDLRLGSDVAIKVYKDTTPEPSARVKQLLQGAVDGARLLEQDRFVRILDVHRQRGWLVMEYLAGSLQQQVQSAPLPVDQVRSVLRQVLQGLAVLHAQDRLHGRIKPANLLLTASGQVKLSETVGCSLADTSSELLRPVGLPRYLAPELLDSRFGPVGKQLDLYALGITALELLTGPTFDTLFPGVGPDAVDPEVGWLRVHSSPEAWPAAVTSLLGQLPPDLAVVIERLIRKDVTARYSDAREALNDLAPSSANESAQASPPIQVSPARGNAAQRSDGRPSLAKRLGLGVALFATIAVALVVMTVFFGGVPGKPDTETPSDETTETTIGVKAEDLKKAVAAARKEEQERADRDLKIAVAAARKQEQDKADKDLKIAVAAARKQEQDKADKDLKIAVAAARKQEQNRADRDLKRAVAAARKQEQERADRDLKSAVAAARKQEQEKAAKNLEKAKVFSDTWRYTEAGPGKTAKRSSGSFMRVSGTLWVEDDIVLEGAQRYRIFEQVGVTQDYVELKRASDGYLVRLYKNRMLVKSAQGSVFTEYRKGQWTERS